MQANNIQIHPRFDFPQWDLAVRSDTQPNLFFRVHNVVVNLHTYVHILHRDPTVLQQEPETLEGVTILVVPLAFRDVEEMLDSLYYPPSGRLPRLFVNESDAPFTLTPVVRLAQALNLPVLEAACKRYVQAQWPSSLTDWDVHERRALDIAAGYRFDPAHRSFLDHRLPEPVSAINFALSFGVSGITAGALATLALIPAESDFDARFRLPYTPVLSMQRAVRWADLDPRHRNAVEEVREHLRREVEDVQSLLLPFAGVPGPTHAVCRAAPNQFLRTHGTELYNFHRTYDALRAWKDLFDRNRLHAAGFCGDCANRLWGAAIRRRQTLWDDYLSRVIDIH